jgi:hypothetical protein
VVFELQRISETLKMETTLTNLEIKERFAEQLRTGRAFIVGLKPTTNPDYKQLEIVQSVELGDRTPSVTAALLGWSTETILRSWQNVKTEIATRIAAVITPGAFADDVMAQVGLTGVFNLQLTEYTEETEPIMYSRNVTQPILEGKTGASPKKNPATDTIITYQGKPVYRNVQLVPGDAINTLLMSDSRTSVVNSALGVTSVAGVQFAQ